MKLDSEKLKSQAEKLDRYINQHVSRSVKVEDALGHPGIRMLNDLLEMILEDK